MKQAKQQNTDLGQAGTFLQTLLSPDEKEKSPASGNESQSHRQINGRPKVPKIDPMVRFSDPPAPPPQQPLPEKPDANSSPPDSTGHSFLKRTDTEPPRAGISGSPTNPQASQILSLVDALTAAKKELDSQGARVKQLEDMLQQERAARETAEERARQLSDSEKPVEENSGSSNTSSTTNSELSSQGPQEQTEITPVNVSSLPFSEGKTAQAPPPDTDLQSRLDLLVAEMQEMKQHMEQYRQRAEKAEQDAASTRSSLTQMIERFRQENAEAAAVAEIEVATNNNIVIERSREAEGTDSNAASPSGKMNRSNVPSLSSEKRLMPQSGSSLVHTQHPSRISSNVHQALVALLQDNDGNPLSNSEVMTSSAPYASMLGVVLIGVGLMAYLNSWQGREK